MNERLRCQYSFRWALTKRVGNEMSTQKNGIRGLGLRSVVGATLLAATQLVWADWGVIDGSTVNYVSLKNDNIAENNAFTRVTGSITDDGSVSIEIDLASVETKVDIRNQRMRDLFFHVAKHPKALITGQLAISDLAQIDAGAPLERTLPVTLSLHGSEADVDAHLRAIAVGDQLFVTTVEPILLYAGDFGLGEGVAALKNIAGLEAIASAIPVTVNLQFVKD